MLLNLGHEETFPPLPLASSQLGGSNYSCEEGKA